MRETLIGGIVIFTLATFLGATAARDFAELCTPLGATPPQPLRVAYHPACSLQNSLKLNGAGEAMLEGAGFVVTPFAESHLCCGSAGTYNILQPDIADRLRARKIGHIEGIGADLIAAGNIGCITQLAAGTAIPVIHPVELIDWATGGPVPEALQGRAATTA